MSLSTQLIYHLLRIMTPEEIGDIATKHNGGKFLSLTDLVDERVEKKIHRDFSSFDYMEEVGQDKTESSAKILPFKSTKLQEGEEGQGEPPAQKDGAQSLSDMAHAELGAEVSREEDPHVEHQENENMSSFILIEKERLKKSQKVLKQKEIIDMYRKNSNVDVEQIRGSNRNFNQSSEAGVLVNKKQY